ncbi:alpha/beta fold hydrolase [Streptomyces sp. NA04227]|uniref:alpha/beta hydrolase n=1 Tax=Streptomyces sp. NA04227 TaxID=2742136 RepID=UPI00158FF525|nr:alpha/beta hydrolase [Streptomyces sp. NA04227]QKW06674.1 alpha/beta fold hydrolase [Streptomyces sp. NA04227]
MTTHARKAVLLTLTAAAVASALTAAGPAGATGSGTGARGGTAPALDWRPCDQPNGPAGQECADLSVPLDYSEPDGQRISLAVTRLRSDRPEARRGTLAVLPGGPGGSGVQRLTQKGKALREATKGQYDLVAFDPRGVGGSTTASCELAPEDRYFTTLRSWPGPDGDITANLDRSRRTAESCHRNGGAVLRSFSTANEVRDLDLLRRALGERKLSAWGSSYGAYVGAVYAQKFPRHTDRVVLDSSGDPDPRRVARGWLANMGQAADDRFPDLAAWAADPEREAEGLRLAERPEDVRPLILALAEKLDREPRTTTTPEVPLTGTVLRQALQSTLYSDAAFPQFAALVKAAQDPARTPELPSALARPMTDEEAAITMGVICNDVRWPRLSDEEFRRAVAKDRTRHPLTAGLPVNVTPCAFWKDRPTEEPTRITSEGPFNILMIQGRRDPATPHFGALEMRRALGDRARMVTVEHGGHGLYLGDGNACGNEAVTTFLTTGRRPSEDVSCPD